MTDHGEVAVEFAGRVRLDKVISGRKALPSGLVSKLWLGIGCRHSQCQWEEPD